MTARVTLSAIRQFPGGFSTPSVTYQVGGVEYTLPIPFQEVLGPVVIFPVMEPAEDASAISMQLDRWAVLHLEHSRGLPLVLCDMATAARAARDFEADSGIAWTSEATELEAWAASWVDQEQVRKAGEQ